MVSGQDDTGYQRVKEEEHAIGWEDPYSDEDENEEDEREDAESEGDWRLLMNQVTPMRIIARLGQAALPVTETHFRNVLFVLFIDFIHASYNTLLPHNEHLNTSTSPPFIRGLGYYHTTFIASAMVNHIHGLLLLATNHHKLMGSMCIQIAKVH